MAVRVRTVALSLLVVVVLGGITAVGWQIVLGPTAREVTDHRFEATEARLARGGGSHLRTVLAQIDRLEPDGTWDPATVITRAAGVTVGRSVRITGCGNCWPSPSWSEPTVGRGCRR